MLSCTSKLIYLGFLKLTFSRSALEQRLDWHRLEAGQL